MRLELSELEVSRSTASMRPDETFSRSSNLFKYQLTKRAFKLMRTWLGESVVL
jgi:hypothetical protein